MANEPIKKTKNGTYYFRIHLGFDDKGKRIQKYKSGFKTKKEARDCLFEFLYQKENYLVAKQDVTLFKEFTEQIFLPWYKTQVKIQTYENRLTIIEAHFKHF